MNKEIRERILMEGARWHARMEAPDCTERDRSACELWQREDPLNAEAFAAATRISAGVARLAGADPRLQDLMEHALAAPVETPRGRWRKNWVRSAAVAAGIAGFALFLGLRGLPVGYPAADTVSYVNTTNRLEAFTLGDGSVVHLDIGTEISVRMSSDARQIELLGGRALFEVAHDAARPFSVTASDTRTVALGTRFQVQRGSDAVVVTLAQGSVVVSSSARGVPRNDTLVPGEQLIVAAGSGGLEKRSIDPQLATSWSAGRHVFRGTPLAEAIVEINRYSARKVRLGDPSLEGLEVGGNFVIGNSELVISALAEALPIRAVDGGSNEIILFWRYDTEIH